MHNFKTLALRSTATLALLGALTLTAQAQVSIDEDTSEQILTSAIGDDVTIDDGVTVTIDESRSGVVLDSDNALVLDGNVTATDINDVTGVELQGGSDRSYTQTGNILLTEDFTNEDTDDDVFVDGTFAEGEGRTGILISGASPFQGNIDIEAGSVITVEGNDSYGINLASTPMMTEGLTGNLTTAGSISVTGDNSVGVNLASNITGDVINEGTVSVRGTGSEAYAISGDIDGGFYSDGTLSSSGYRFNQRLGFLGDEFESGREDLSAEDLNQGGSALRIEGNVTEGIILANQFTPILDDNGDPVLDDDGEPTSLLTGTSSVTQFGSAPAVIIDGNGTPIAIGVVAEITDPTDADFDEDLQYGFINQGTITANGLFDDVDATALSVANVTFDGGISNSGTMSVTTFRAATETDLSDGDGIARVIVLGDQAIADTINNSGIILATANEAADEIYFDPDNVIPARELLAVGVDIEENASTSELINAGLISAVLVGREGQAVAIRDASGTLTMLENTGSISALAGSSDTSGEAETSFDLIAIDLSAATTGIMLTQSQSDTTTFEPQIIGDILLGSGDDSIDISAGAIVGDIDFGSGDDSLSLSGDAAYAGSISNTDSLALNVTDTALLAFGNASTINVSEATFDETAVYRPLIDGETGTSTTLSSSGDITFEGGATINPILNSVIGSETTTYTIATAGNLTVEDLDALGAGDAPFLYSTTLGLQDDNTLVVTLDLRDPTASIADGGLGLDAAQAAAFGTVVDGELQAGAVMQALASVTDIGNAFSNITDAGEFYSAYNQLLPEFSGAALQFVLANVDGAVGAVGSHLDTTRRSPDKTGGAWLQEFFYFADRELAGQSEQYRGEGFGFAGGLDTAFGPFHAVGVNLSFASTEIEDVVGVDDPLGVTTFQTGAYAGYQTGGFNFDVYGGVGTNKFEQNRVVEIDSFSGTASSEWTGLHANGSLRAGYTVPLGEKFWARPSVSLDYLYLNEEGHTETGTDGVRLHVNGRVSETAAATAMLDVGAKFQGKRTWIRPSIRAGYRNEFISDPLLTEFRFQGLESATGELFDSELASLRAFAFPDESLILGFTVAAGSEYSSIGFDFDSDIRDGFIRHTGRIVIRLLF